MATTAAGTGPGQELAGAEKETEGSPGFHPPFCRLLRSSFLVPEHGS